MPGNIVLLIIYLGIFDSAVAFMLMIYSLKELGPTVVAIYTNFMPVMSTVFSLILLREAVTAVQLIGGVVVVAASIYVIRERQSQTSLQ